MPAVAPAAPAMTRLARHLARLAAPVAARRVRHGSRMAAAGLSNFNDCCDPPAAAFAPLPLPALFAMCAAQVLRGKLDG